MDTSLERIRAKIADLEQKIADLRIAERELNALSGSPAAKPRNTAASSPAAAEPTQATAPTTPRRGRRKAPGDTGPRQTIGASIAEVLEAHGPLPATEISEKIKESGRDITNRMVSFALQAMKKRNLVKNADGKWAVVKPRGK